MHSRLLEMIWSMMLATYSFAPQVLGANSDKQRYASSATSWQLVIGRIRLIAATTAEGLNL